MKNKFDNFKFQGNTIATPSASASLGVCVKTIDQVVRYQNPTCESICGKQLGTKCEKGCMQRYSSMHFNEAFDLGMRIFKNIDTEEGTVDATVVHDGEMITTLLIKNEPKFKKQMDYLQTFKLSRAEIKVMTGVLAGLSNQDVANQLFISKRTLRTHLNNIYKKIPSDILNQLLLAIDSNQHETTRQRSRPEIKK